MDIPVIYQYRVSIRHGGDTQMEYRCFTGGSEVMKLTSFTAVKIKNPIAAGNNQI